MPTGDRRRSVATRDQLQGDAAGPGGVRAADRLPCTTRRELTRGAVRADAAGHRQAPRRRPARPLRARMAKRRHRRYDDLTRPRAEIKSIMVKRLAEIQVPFVRPTECYLARGLVLFGLIARSIPRTREQRVTVRAKTMWHALIMWCQMWYKMWCNLSRSHPASARLTRPDAERHADANCF